MPSSASSSSQMEQSPERRVSRSLTASVIIIRIFVGAVFMVSGFVKMIDVWGFIYKIEEYLAVWGYDIPRSLTLCGAIALCAAEFVGGALVATGMLKRVAVWGLTLMMAGMTVLTVWIYAADPVSDCGCFGEFMHLSNGATLAKNIVLLGLLIFLCRYNSRVRASLLHPSIQWIGITLLCAYIVIIGLYGYNVQPMLDFRPFKTGTPLLPEHTDDEDDEPLVYIYEKDGEKREFSIDALPDETWAYVDAVDDGGEDDDASTFTIYDVDGEDATEDAIVTDGTEILLIVSEPSRMDISYTYELNELSRWASENGVEMVGLLASGRRGIEFWLDMSMAAYPCYTVEDTRLKELSRGVMSLVLLRDGKIVFKRSLASITSDDIDAIISGRSEIDALAPDGETILWRMSIGLVILFVIIYLLQDAIQGLTRRLRRLDKRLRDKDTANKE